MDRQAQSTRRVGRGGCAAAVLVVCLLWPRVSLGQSGEALQGPRAAPAPTGAVEARPLGAPKRGTPPAARTGGAPESRGWVSQTSLMLALVLGVAGVGLTVFKSAVGKKLLSIGPSRSPAGLMEILGRYPIGRGSTLVLLKLDRRILLLSQSTSGKLGLGTGLTTLCEIEDPDEIASILVKIRDADGDSMSERFRSMLTRFDREMPDDGASDRRVRTASGVDRAEIWDDARVNIPVVDVTRFPSAPDAGSAAGSLRRRLAAFKWPGGEGQGA